MRTYIFILCFFLITGCVSSTQNTSTSTSTSSTVNSISSHGGISGMWKGAVDRGLGALQRVSFEFNQKGDTLTGACLWGSKSTPILNGRIDGNKITFQNRIKAMGITVTSYYEGTVNGDLISIIYQRKLAPMEGDTLMKVKGNFRRVN